MLQYGKLENHQSLDLVIDHKNAIERHEKHAIKSKTKYRQLLDLCRFLVGNKLDRVFR